MAGALGEGRVLDLTGCVAGQYCGRLLADYGAEVILVEPPDGSPIRRQQPLDPATGESLAFLHLNAGKRSLVLDPAAENHERRFRDLTTTADVILAEAAPETALLEANPRLIWASVTPFGTAGAHAGWRGCEIVYQALSGTMLNNGSAGREPLYGCGERASYAAGLALYIGVVSALLERETSGRGQTVDIAIAEVAASMSTAATAYNYSGLLDGGRGRGESLVNCRGEWVTLWVYPYQWRDFCTALGIDHLHDDPRFASIEARHANWTALVSLVQERVADLAADEVVARMQAHRLITAKAASLTSLLADPQLLARGFWENDGADGRRALGPPFRLAASPRRPLAGAPALGDAP
jgi:crotonobetainyl-CoA:carnitine CoA-transferase CaiB-like acyl-CoA transferase